MYSNEIKSEYYIYKKSKIHAFYGNRTNLNW